ncbi:MAG: SRPBCC family protein [Pseudomonadota bacterium]
MKLSTREDIAVPIAEVFSRVTDFEEFERRAMRRGAEISRTDPVTGPGQGSQWEATFMFRGRERRVQAQMDELQSPEKLSIGSKSSGLDGSFDVQLVALSPSRTRMIVGLELRPQNLSARLLVQSLKLAKASLAKRYAATVSDFAKGIEAEYTPTNPGMTLS